jgi:hypothetical protein
MAAKNERRFGGSDENRTSELEPDEAPRARGFQGDLGIVLVTAPNYSLILNVPRQDNLHNMKRIALVWAEFMAGGVACALHVNGRTPYDYMRWRDFVAERPEVRHIAFEFGTGAGSSARSPLAGTS